MLSCRKKGGPGSAEDFEGVRLRLERRYTPVCCIGGSFGVDEVGA